MNRGRRSRVTIMSSVYMKKERRNDSSVAQQEKLGLRGKVALVTGASSGIGFAISKILGLAGCSVAMIDKDSESGKKALGELERLGITGEFYCCDVSNSREVEETVKKVYEHFRRIDVVVNCAGIIIRKDIADLSEDEWDRILDIDLKGVFLVSHYSQKYMRSGGSIINIGSGWGLKGGPKAVAYCAAKGGVVNMTRAMAIDLGPRNIRVNCVNPGDVETPMLRNEAMQLGEDVKKFLDEAGNRPIRRIGKPEDVAYAVLYLASDLASWVTGSNMVVDGGGLA